MLLLSRNSRNRLIKECPINATRTGETAIVCLFMYSTEVKVYDYSNAEHKEAIYPLKICYLCEMIVIDRKNSILNICDQLYIEIEIKNEKSNRWK